MVHKAQNVNPTNPNPKLPDTKELNAQTAFTTAHTRLTFLDDNNSIFTPLPQGLFANHLYESLLGCL